MKKNNLIILSIIFAVIFLAGCGKTHKSEINGEENQLGGYGEISQGTSETPKTALYDDEKCYFPVWSLEGTICYCLDKDTYRVNCMDAACNHTGSCKACVSNDLGFLLSFGGKLYRITNEKDYSNGNGIAQYIGRIEEYSSGKVVFDNPIPDDLSEELAVEDYTGIESVKKIDEENLIVFGRHHNYIVDNNWNIKYWFGDIGKFYWGDIVDDKFYYVDDLYLLKEVDLKSIEKRTIDLGMKVLQASYMDDVGIVYIGDFMDMYIYDIEEGKSRKIHNNCELFSIFDNRIYTSNDEKSIILDSDGNEVGEFGGGLSSYELVRLGDRLYNYDGNKVISMKLDGSDIRIVESR